MYSGHARLCPSVCLSVPRRKPALLQGPGCKLAKWYGVPSSFAVLGRFAIGAGVSLLWQHSVEREMSASACIRSMPGSEPRTSRSHQFRSVQFNLTAAMWTGSWSSWTHGAGSCRHIYTELVSWSLTSFFSTNMAVSETNLYRATKRLDLLIFGLVPHGRSPVCRISRSKELSSATITARSKCGYLPLMSCWRSAAPGMHGGEFAVEVARRKNAGRQNVRGDDVDCATLRGPRWRTAITHMRTRAWSIVAASSPRPQPRRRCGSQ